MNATKALAAANPDRQTSDKFLSLDLLRGLACLMVVVIHTTSTYLIEPSREAYRLLFAGLNTFAGAAVAVFIFISGMSLTLGYMDRTIHYITFIKRRVLRVGLPFVVWALFYALVINRGLFFKGASGFLGLALGFSMYHLYYMVIILQFYIVYPFLLKLHKALPYIGLTVVCFIIGIWSEKQNISLGSWRLTDRVLLTYFGYFSLGILAGLRQKKWCEQLARWLKPLGVLWLAAGLTATLQVYTYYSPWRSDFFGFGGYRYLVFAVITILFGYGFSDWLSQRSGDAAAQSTSRPYWQLCKQSLKGISESSLDIYLVHPFFLAAFDWLWARLPRQDSIFRFILTFVFVFGAALVFSRLKSAIINMYKCKMTDRT